MPSFQQMFYGVVLRECAGLRSALSFRIFHKCKYEAQKLLFTSCHPFEETPLGPGGVRGEKME